MSSAASWHLQSFWQLPLIVLFVLSLSFKLSEKQKLKDRTVRYWQIFKSWILFYVPSDSPERQGEAESWTEQLMKNITGIYL